MLEILQGMDPIIQLLIILVIGAFFVGLLKFIVENALFVILFLGISIVWLAL